MLEVINSIAAWFIKKRVHQIELFIKYPIEVQEDVRRKLLHDARNTQWGQQYGYADLRTARQYAQRVPTHTYEQLQPYITKIMQGEQNVLWHSKIGWFAKSSGTTNDKSKFIPVSNEALEECHYKAGKDMLAVYCNNYPESKIFSGKILAIGGSHQISQLNPNMYYGDLSAVLMQNLPFWVSFMRTPDLSIALLDNWEEKVEKMGLATLHENVVNISGVPTWTMVLFNWLLAHTGKSNILEIWENFELYCHGGVSFEPYRAQFQQYLPSAAVKYVETYNASEGFFGIQDQTDSQDILLMLDYGIYYEFIKASETHHDNPRTLTLAEVEINQNYAVIISTNAGLWRYAIGDTIRFTSIYPFRFKITGRTKHFINAFGEELIIENAEQALHVACQATQATITDYTAAPIYLTQNTKGAHQWAIEFETKPNDFDKFCAVLDDTLKNLNSDYDAKRKGNLAMDFPVVQPVPQGTFYHWLKNKGKLGGQNKVPRLSNERKILEEILLLSQQ
jgi:hypothetical protein